MKYTHLLLLLILFSPRVSVSQCVFVGDSAGNVSNSNGSGMVHFNVNFQNGSSLANLNQVINYCGFDFPNVAMPFTGNTTPSIVTYTFSVPLTSVDIAIGAAGLNGNILPETFVFNTDAGVAPTLFVNSGSCAQWTITGNQSTSPNVVGAVNSIHTVSSATPFNSVSISSTDNNIHGGSVFALCNGSLVIDCPPEAFGLGNDTSICNSSSILLDATTPNSSYVWQDGSNSSQFAVTQSGNYWVEINEQGCIYSDTISISILEAPSAMSKEVKLCSEAQSLLLQAYHDESFNYLWDDGTTNSQTVIFSEGVYSVQISNLCGSNVTEFIVDSEQCFCEVYIPNSFTPDGNESNNDLAVYSQCDLSFYQFEIFNRWGEKLFLSNDFSAFWDGSSNGTLAPSGIYTWKLTYAFQDENTQIKVGHTNLLR